MKREWCLFEHRRTDHVFRGRSRVLFVETLMDAVAWARRRSWRGAHELEETRVQESEEAPEQRTEAQAATLLPSLSSLYFCFAVASGLHIADFVFSLLAASPDYARPLTYSPHCFVIFVLPIAPFILTLPLPPFSFASVGITIPPNKTYELL